MPMRKRQKPMPSRQLANISLFARCTDEELAKIDSLLTEVKIDSGEVLCREGAEGAECFIIVEGDAKVTLRGKQIATFGPGSVFGEMSLLDGGPRSATVTAESPMRLYVLDRGSFFALLRDAPDVTEKILRALAERLRATEKAPVR
jgi:CRP/FNR family transcriptional regulator, cyclic AMP receptor protein